MSWKWGSEQGGLPPDAVFISRKMASLMKASEGAFSHEAIMRLYWRLFDQYCDAFLWVSREGSDQHSAKNKADDEALFRKHPQVQWVRKKALEAIKQRIKPHREKYEAGNIEWGKPKEMG